MSTNTEIDPNLASQLEILREQPVRDPQKVAGGRAAFLAQAREMLDSHPLPVSIPNHRRHNRWMQAIQSFQTAFGKERSPMFGTLGTILLVISLVLGGSGVTVAAAQNSLPDQALYPVKTWSEDLRVGLTRTEQSRLQLALELSNRRAEEIAAMIRAGQTPPDAVPVRMQAEIELALRLAAGQPDQYGIPALNQIREQLQQQEKLFLHLGTPATPQANAALERARAMLQDQLRLCQDGIADPAALRDQLRARERDQFQLHDTPPAPAQQQTQTGAGNPWTTGTPTPGSGYGPGDGDGVGDGGNNPWTTGTPTPGSGYGPGPGDCSGCTATPGANQPGDGNDGGNNGGSDDNGGSDNGGGSDAGSDNGGGSDDGGGSGTGGDNGGGSGTGGGGGGK